MNAAVVTPRLCAIVVGLLAGAAAASATYAPGPCPVHLEDKRFTVDCGVLQVPESRGSDGGRRVALPVVRVRATASPARPDPVVFLHGGPGGGVMDEVPDKLRDARWQQLLAGERDWIFFDQRGGGLAHPLLDCGELGLSDTGFTSDAGVTAASACAQRLTSAGVDLSQYNVETTVADLVDLKTALGYDTVNLYGRSYGSRVAFAAQQYAPGHLRAVVHDSPYPPEAKGTELLPVLLAREIRQTLALCVSDPACSAAYPDLEARLDAELATWNKTPRRFADRDVTASDLASFLLAAIYEWDGIRALPGDLERILDGDLTPVIDYLDGGGDFAEGQLLAHFCKEELPFEDAASMARRAGGDLLAEATLTNTRRLFRACADWPVGPPNPRENEPVESDIPTLLIAAEIDAGCPTDFSEAAVRSLRRGQYVAVPNAVHDLTSNSDCVAAMVRRFLDEPTSGVDDSCLATEHATLHFDLP